MSNAQHTFSPVLLEAGSYWAWVSTMVNTACERLLWSFICVAAVVRSCRVSVA